MAVERQLNLLSQQRLDIPDLRSVESAVAGDFDVLAGKALAGGYPLVVRGFAISSAGTVLASALQLVVADGIVFNVNATEAGSFLWVPETRAAETLDATTNAKVIGAFVAGAVNNIGIDFIRAPDSTTTDLVQFKNLTTGLEDPRQVPKASTLDYQIVITTAPFSTLPNLIPVARVTTNSSNIVTQIEDVRAMMYRLGSGGDTASQTHAYPWPQSRSEGLSGNALFTGGDKAVRSQKDWVDAIMTRVWEIGGGERWFSASSDRNVQLTTNGATFSNGEYFEWIATTNLHWKGLRFLFDNSTGTFNDVADQTGNQAGLTDLVDGECIYVDLDRSANRTGGSALAAQKAPLTSLGAGTPPGSRWIIAWRKGADIFTRGWRYPVGTTFQPATTSSLGVVELNQTPGSALIPVVVSIMADGRIVVAATAGNTTGATFTGFGTGSGMVANGGATGRGLLAFGGLNSTGAYGEGGGTGYGVDGKGGPTNGAGVRGTGVGTGSGVNGYNDPAGPDGVAAINGISQSANGIGVWAIGTGNRPALKAVAASTGHGVDATGGSGGGHGTHGTSPVIGAYGEATANGGIGVYGVGDVGTTANGVHGEAIGTGIGVKGTAASISGYGLQSSVGHVGAPAASNFQFTATKTGVIIVPMTDLTLGGPFSSGATGVLTANGLKPSIADGSMNSPHWQQGTVGVTERLVGGCHVPRGATITAVELWIENSTGSGIGPGGTFIMKHHTYSGVGTPTTVNILAGSTIVVVPNASNGWFATTTSPTASALETGRTGNNNSGWVSIEFQPTATGASVYRFGGIRITYTYTEVDFMV